MLRWTGSTPVARAQVFRDGRLLDDFPARGPSTWTDHLLWMSQTYRYEVRLLDAQGAMVKQLRAALTTPAQRGAFPRLYADSSFINQPIAAPAAADPGSVLMVARALVAFTGRANLANSDAWGGALAYADPHSRTYSVSCRRYGCDQDVPAFPIPRYALPATGSDAQLSVLDPDTHRELDMWQASHDASADSWSAATRVLLPDDGSGAPCAPGERCLGTVAAGFAFFAGIVRPEEIAQGHIDHALVLMTPHTRRDLIACPAVGGDGVSDDPGALPEGARVQLDPAYDVAHSGLARWQQVIARALQQYGAYVVDTGGSLAIRAESNLLRGYDAWARAGVPSDYAMLDDLPWARMRVLQMQRC